MDYNVAYVGIRSEHHYIAWHMRYYNIASQIIPRKFIGSNNFIAIEVSEKHMDCWSCIDPCQAWTWYL